EEVIARHVGLVADRNERRDAKSAAAGVVDSGETQRTALGEETDVAGRGGVRPEGSIQADVRIRIDEANTIWADQANARFPTRDDQLLLSGAARFTHLCEAGGDHHQRLHAGCNALLNDA